MSTTAAQRDRHRTARRHHRHEKIGTDITEVLEYTPGKDVLSRIADYLISRVAELLPQNWKPATPI
ncbi:MAG: hypothetical protein ONB46_14375 [candidate division KSB1 bacterium]|nr:hypothetical protein [candidate division KSB1 bacterium]MDZ7364309.1 hypothetical protein [candidate division KSB1 bacterium]MDZ7405033.1 hypothetical protein [candidate division KSB1 bacterium]